MITMASTSVVAESATDARSLRSELRQASIALERCHVRLGSRTIVDNVSLQIAAGQLTALVGPNGAGKSTLLAAMAGDLRPTSGQVVINGQPIGGFSSRALAQVRSVLPQHSDATFPFRVEDVVRMGRFPWQSDMRTDDTVCASALARVGMTHMADRSFMTLSGGEQALVSLARVLAQATPIVLLDEPTAALDLGHQELVLGVASQLASEGCGVVVVVHDLNLAARFADRVVVLADGAVVADGTPAEAFEPELLSTIYRHDVVVLDHPLLPGRPLVLPRPV
jgi:iron complex transport system ATP-binding protein